MELHWPGCQNARDLGGLPTVDGGRIAGGALIRSGHHGRLTPETIAEIRASGVRRILDLRWERELARDPSPFAADPVYLHVPLLNDVIEYEVDPHSYGPMLDHNQQRIRAAFAALADAPPGGVIVHCHGGRDRTGALIALALSVAGVPDEVIAEDYARTADAEALAMINTMRHVREAESYLLTIGVTPQQIAATRTRLQA